MAINWSLVIGSSFVAIGLLYIILVLLNINIFNTFKKCLLIALILTVYLYFSYTISMSFIRYTIFVFICSILISCIYKINITKCIASTFFSWIFFLVSEIILAIIIFCFFDSNISYFSGQAIGNFFVTVIALSIYTIPFIRKTLKKLLNRINSNFQIFIILFMILTLSFSIIVYINFFNDKSVVNFVLSLIIIFAQIIITISLFLERDDKNKIKYEYDALLKNLEEYESILDYQRVTNHENKNQLLVIRGMINKKEKNIVDYIDSLIKEKHEDNETFLYQTNKIPSGGLRGLVYYKVLLMKEKNINVFLNINSKIRKIHFDQINVDLNKDLCKIVGVIIDNAIDAVKNIKNKEITIEMDYENGKFLIEVHNTFQGMIDFNNIDKKGFSTKGSGRGYGLSLVKELLEKNKNIQNKRIISGNVFIQQFIIDITN